MEIKYEGQNGLGKLTIPGQFIYEGEFVNGKMQGKGVKTWINNNRRYVGEFKNDEPNGYGTLTFFNGDVYEGEFRNGDSDGIGIYRFGHFIYEGEFSDGTFNGRGVLTNKIKNTKSNVTFKDGKEIF